MKILKIGAITLLTLVSAELHAVSCTEKITTVIIEKNGIVHFQTDTTCDNAWCKLNWSSTEAVNRGYSMLLTAHTANKDVKINWSTITSCTQDNPLGASPEYIYIMNSAN